MSSNSSSRQAHERTAHQGAERQGVAGVGQHARERDEVLNLLTAEQSLAGLRGDREPAGFKRALIAPKLRARRGQQRDAARRERRKLAVLVADRSRCRSAARRDRRRLRLRRRGSRAGREVRRHIDRDLGDARQIVIRRIERRGERDVAWLTPAGQRRFEAAVDVGQDRRP